MGLAYQVWLTQVSDFPPKAGFTNNLNVVIKQGAQTNQGEVWYTEGGSPVILCPTNIGHGLPSTKKVTTLNDLWMLPHPVGGA